MQRCHLRLAFAALTTALSLGGAATAANAAPVTQAAATRTAAHAAASITPDIGTVNCGFASNLDIDYSKGTVCFSGSGYLGIYLYKVTNVTASTKSWIRIYLNGTTDGSYFNLAPNHTYPFYGAYSVTQVCDDCGYHSP